MVVYPPSQGTVRRFYRQYHTVQRRTAACPSSVTGTNSARTRLRAVAFQVHTVGLLFRFVEQGTLQST